MKLLRHLLLLAMFAACLPLQAQGGCVNSPENPSVVLSLVGFAGAIVAHLRRSRGLCS